MITYDIEDELNGNSSSSQSEHSNLSNIKEEELSEVEEKAKQNLETIPKDKTICNTVLKKSLQSFINEVTTFTCLQEILPKISSKLK